MTANQIRSGFFGRSAAFWVCVFFSFHVQADPGMALRFNGTNGYVSVPHDAALDAYPLTITAWVRTARTALLYDAILNKYSPGSFNGYSFHIYNGRLRAWYFRNGSNYVYPADPGFDGGFIADGQWHHVALVISPSGGTIYIDGAARGTPQPWTGSAGATSTAQQISIGRYNVGVTSSLAGDIDEVAIWNRALGTNELNYIKHRRLRGTEDGLLSLWHMDEGFGTTTADAAPAARIGSFVNPVAWVTSAAPIMLSGIATNCLKLDGVNDSAVVSHVADLNSFPFTAMAWVRTSRANIVGDGITSKYTDSSFLGYSMHLSNGRLRAWYFRNPSNYVWDGGNGIDGGFIADGDWHHVALVVDANRGQLIVDGNVTGSLNWTGTAGATASTDNLQIGQYGANPTYPGFSGDIDEVTVWNRALTTNEIQSLKNLPLAGNESGLVSYWRFDENSGNASDATGHGHTATLLNGAARASSTAFLGDGSVHLVGAADIPFNQQLFAITGAYGVSAFGVKANATLWRFYDFGNAPPNSTVTFKLDAGLRIAGSGTPLSVKSNTYSFTFSHGAYNASSPVVYGTGGMVTLNQSMNVEPQIGVQLDSVNNLHQMTAALSHNENSGAFTTDGTEAADVARLLHFNGHVMFGNIDTVVSNVINTPTPGSLFAPSYIQSQLQLGANGAYFAIAPGGVRFGGGAAFTVNLGVNGTATNVNGSFSLSAANQFFEAAGIRYQLPGATLNNTGLSAGNLLAWFPTGLGMTLNTDVRTMLPYASKTNIAIGPDLLPTTTPVVFTAASYNTNRLYFAEETKPLLFGAPQIEWRVPEGYFYIAAAQTMQFVRQGEDDDLITNTNLLGQLAGDRISNDGYYRNAVSDGTPIVIRPDTNGASLLTMNVLLQPTEFRPHFPYLNRNIGGHIPSTGGAISIVDDLIDPASYLFVGGPVPLPYARDCAAEGGCGSFATNGAQVLNFIAPAGGLGTPHLNFTSDGGLLAYGSLTTPTNLTWGFIGGANYAQRTSDVQTGALEVAGTFLVGQASSLPNAQRPAALLFTGWGDETNSAYVERPDQIAYADGFANYSGLNFRRPASGRSFIAGQDTGVYPLTPRAKYYTRYGGVSGIHESASFPNSNLTLYGYPFTFASYRLSFLDSDNWESRTDGTVSLPVPAGFVVEFEHMKFLCRGNLSEAQLPPAISPKHMVYWNTDIKPLSLQFQPLASDPCSLSTRFLVLGVETKLPFIPQAFHAALGFKPNGNLVNKATGVAGGVDSRFAVPVNLKLQGPGESFYPLTTAGDGYFNNWETPGKPQFGFYNLVGRIRVPFFRDVKIQLHVTPTSTTNSQIAMMGGWPAEAGLGANRGWTNGPQDYFNTAKFDANADGWPAALVPNIENYRRSPDQNYRPRAQQNWIDVAGFDYPLAWDPLLLEFSGFTEAIVTLPVIDVNSRLKELSPGKVDFDFAQDLNLKLPRIKVLDLANDALNELNAPINTLSNSIRAAIQEQLDTTGLTRGFRSLQNVMRENTEGFFRPVLDQPLSNVVEVLYPVLASSLAISKNNLLANTAGILGASSNGLQTAIQNLNGTAAAANSVIGQLDQTFKDVDDTLGLFLRVLEKDAGGTRHVIRVIVQKLAQDQGPAVGIVASLGDSLVNDLLADLEPTLAKVETELLKLQSQFRQLRQQAGRVTLDNDFNEALDTANHNAAALQNYLQQANFAVSNLLGDVVGPAGDYFTSNPARAKKEIRERLTIAFLSSAVDGKYQQTFRQFLTDKNFLLDQLMNVLFDQVNRTLRDGIEKQVGIAGAQDGVFKYLKGAGQLSQSLASAKIRGSPKFTGDSLDSIHLDANIRVNLPDEMKFTAYLDIVRLKSATTAIACIPPGAPAAEVTLGANDVPLDWAGVPSADGKKMRLSVAARWTLQSGAVKGIGGSLDIKGQAGFKGCNLAEIRAALAIGSIENYFAGQGKATVIILGVPVNFHAGIFAGHACSLDALKFVDPEVEQVVQQPGEFSGVYVEYGGGLSLSDILFGVSGDLLDVRADITTALFYQGGPRLGRLGGRQKVTVDIKLLYVLEGSGSWAVFVILDTAGQLTVGGSVEVCGRLGVCPFCVKGCKDVTIKGVINDGGIDYFIDY